jgi:glycosyltransferase involved in cell wall biosynthesis
MRVVHVTPYFAPAYIYGGPPRSILGLCRGLKSAGVDVEVVTTTANGSSDIRESSADGDVVDGIRVRYARRRSPGLFFNAAVRAPIRRALKNAHLCHIHGVWNVPEWIATQEARALKMPFVLSPRGMLLDGALVHHAWRKRILLRAFEEKNVRSAARLHATSAAEAERLMRFADPAKIIVAPNGVDLDEARAPRRPVRSTAGIADGDPIVLFVGRVHPIKRIDLIAAAMSMVRHQHPRARLVIAGPDEAGTLRTLGPALDAVGGAVRYVGHVDEADKWAWMHEAAVLVCCSDSENFGMSVAEAMAASIPVVVTRTCPWPDVERVGAGFWVDQQAAPIADSIGAVLGDPNRARVMGERGRELVQRSYSWTAIGQQMARCYDAVLRESRAAVA